MSEARRLATYEDLLRLPEEVVGEIVDGELYASPRPASPHIRAMHALGGELYGAFGRRRSRAPGGWVIMPEAELHLGEHVLVPDMSGWRRARMPVTPKAKAFTLHPDWVCEALSPSTNKLDRLKKLPLYARFGVGHAWLIDPVDRTHEVYRLHEEHWLLLGIHGDDEPVRAEPFEEIEFDLSEWWLDPDAPPA